MLVSLQKARPLSAFKGRLSPTFSRASNALFLGTNATPGNILAVATEDGLVHFWYLSSTSSSSAIIEGLKAAPDPISSFRPYTANSRCSTRVAWIPLLSGVSKGPHHYVLFSSLPVVRGLVVQCPSSTRFGKSATSSSSLNSGLPDLVSPPGEGSGLIHGRPSRARPVSLAD